jgi:hypothetical protein
MFALAMSAIAATVARQRARRRAARDGDGRRAWWRNRHESHLESRGVCRCKARLPGRRPLPAMRHEAAVERAGFRLVLHAGK